MLWINFLHLYQPATVDNETIVEATEKSYRRIFGALKRHRSIRFTVNISGCLLERWLTVGYADLVDDIRKLQTEGQIELTGSAANHSLLSLLPESENERQIEANNEILKNIFGPRFRPKGFFIPEAAYDRKVAKLIKRKGFKWILLDEAAANGDLKGLDFSVRYRDAYSGLQICFRSRKYSKCYVPQTIHHLLKAKKEKTVVTATDAELYGLRHLDQSGHFEKLLNMPSLETATVSQYLSGLKKEKKVSPVASSWESTRAELARKNPYRLWRDRRNKIQNKLWELAELAIETVNRFSRDKNWSWARKHLDNGLASCTFWWASARDFRLFAPISWSPDEIERGTNELIRSVRALDNVATRPAKIKAEKLYIAIKRMIWEKHWRYYWKK